MVATSSYDLFFLVDWDEGFLLFFANYLGLARGVFWHGVLVMDRRPLFSTFLALVSISYVASSPFWVASSCMVPPSRVVYQLFDLKAYGSKQM